MDLNTISTAPGKTDQEQYCTVTHPFHPLYGKKILIVSLKQTWGEDRVFYRQGDGRITSIPACWTSIYEPRPFNVISKDRSVFRFQELLELTRLIEDYNSEIILTTNDKYKPEIIIPVTASVEVEESN
ncbi:DUF5372 family protein [Planctomycetota bacterium]